MSLVSCGQPYYVAAQVRNPDFDEGAKNQVRVRHAAQVRKPDLALSPG